MEYGEPYRNYVEPYKLHDELPVAIGDELAGARAAIHWLGHLANKVDHYLKAVPQPNPTTPDWSALDADGQERFAVDLDHTLGIERAIQCSLIWGGFYSHTLPRKSEDKLRYRADQYRNQLPFSRGELYWLDGVYKGISRRQDGRVVPTTAALRAERADFSDPGGGRRRQSSGAELTDRWWDWRRGIGEFANGSTHDQAHKDLVELHALMGSAWIDDDWEERLGLV